VTVTAVKPHAAQHRGRHSHGRHRQLLGLPRPRPDARDEVGTVTHRRRRAGLAAVAAVLMLTSASAAPDRVEAREPVGNAAAQLGVVGAPSLPASHWEQVYRADWESSDLARFAELSRSRDSWSQYELAYGIDESTALFRATGRIGYAGRALTWAENVVASSRVSRAMPTSQFRDQYRGWVSESDDSRGQEVPLPESYLWRYVTTLLRAVRDSSLYSDPSYRARYDRLLDFARVNVFGKWVARGSEENVYRSRTHMAAHWAQIALNLEAIDPDPGHRARYRTVTTRIDDELRGQLRSNPAAPAAYFWSDRWGRDERPGQDVAHGNGVIAYLVDARETGQFWTATDLDRMCLLLVKVVAPGPSGGAEFVDGSGTGTGWLADGFVKLGRYDPAVQARLAEHTVVNGQFVANLALNARILAKGSGSND
jgi:hypothetical protein